jgi:Fic family protein
MKIPQTPPSFDSILGSLPRDRLSAVLEGQRDLVKKDRYLHWDDLKRRTPPDGFTHKEWWLVLKSARSTRLRPVPLLDKKGHAFRVGVPDSLAELLSRIDRGLGATLGIPDAVDSPPVRDRYVINTLIQESITSSQLEGAATTREVAKEMLRTGRPPRDKSERMILNNYLTMQRILDLTKTELTGDMVFEVHRRITDGTLDRPDAAGRLRKGEERVRVEDMEGNIFHEPPSAAQLPARLEAMCRFANGETPDFFLHPVVRAIVLHFWLAYDHPFVDGNGRTARALFYWSMLRQDYRLFEFISISEILVRAPTRYAEAFLFTETDENDLTYFVLHQAQVIRDAVEALHKYLDQKKSEFRAAAACLDGVEGLNHRQQALLAHALREPHTRYLIAAHQRSHGVTHQTARDDLFDLVARGLLVVSQEGRRYIFRAPGDLTSKLDRLAHRPPAPGESEPTLPLKLPFQTRHD